MNDIERARAKRDAKDRAKLWPRKPLQLTPEEVARRQAHLRAIRADYDAELAAQTPEEAKEHGDLLAELERIAWKKRHPNG